MGDPGTREFLVPDLGEGLEEATVVTWLVAVGDTVILNQPLCVVETAKAEVEVPSPHAGTVLELGGAEGETLRVGTLLTRISQAGDAPTGETETETAPAPTSTEGTRPEPTLVGYGHDDAIDRSRRGRRGAAPPDTDEATPQPGPRASGRALAKPPVRRLAHTLGVDLAALAPGAGPGGIVTRADVEAAATHSATPTDGTSAPRPDSDEIVPVRGIRARIAERMTTSRSRIPDATCSVVVDCSRMLDVRTALNAAYVRRGGEPVITPFSLICALLVRALGSNRLLNATFVDDGPEIRVHGSVHLGVGAATSRGLVVPVVRDAGRRSVIDVSTEMARLRDGARAGSLTPTELQGSTFTVSNFGALGLDEGIPVINHPEAAILGVGAVRLRPHVVDGEVVARHTATLTLAFDHRVCDGGEAAGLLRDLRELIEAPELALLHP